MRKLLIAIFLLFVNLNAAEESEILDVYQLFNVKTTEVQEETITLEDQFYGRVVPDERTVVDVVLRFDGYVEALQADFTYKEVKKGEILFEYYSPEILAAQVELINALRYKSQQSANLIESAREKLRLFDVDEATISKVEKSKKTQHRLPYRAPADGIIISKSINLGSSFKKGQTLFVIADLKKLWVETDIYQESRQNITLGMRAQIKFKGFEKLYSGKVEYLNPVFDEKKQTFSARIGFVNPALSIYPGMFGEVNLIQTQKSMLTLPKTAVITKGQKHIVFLAGEYEGEYEPQLIEARRLPGGKFEILSGLDAGQKVVNNSLFMLDSDAQMNGMY